MEVGIRKAEAGDYLPLVELFREVDVLHGENLPHIFQKPAGPGRSRDYYQELLADENTAIFVAGMGQKPVGFVHAVVRLAPDLPIFVRRRYAVVEGIGVKSEFQNQGVGRMLMGAVHSWAIARGASAIELNVYEFNQPAIAFYKGMGYETLSRKMSKSLKSG